MPLLPKPDGGRRPIGFCQSILGLWMRVRLQVAQAWQAQNERPYFFAGPSKGVEVAAWKQAARAALGAVLSEDYAAVLLDLVKAFERVSRRWLARQGAKHGYNLYFVRF